MQHLTIEALARLLDEPPDAEQAAHLAACAACRLELTALEEQTSALAELPDIRPPADAWPALATRLRDEGLVQDDSASAARARAAGVTFAGWSRHRVLRLAASIALFLFGGGAGFAARGVVVAPAMVAGADQRPSEPSGSGTVRAAAPSSAEEAARLVRTEEAEYLRALTRYAEMARSPATTDPVARFAALESIVVATRAALDQAPADPVINGYHLTALAQREAMLRRFAVTAEDNWF